MLKKLFLVTLLFALVVSGFIGISIFVVGEFDSTQLKLLGTTACVGAFCLTGLASVTGSSTRWFRALPYLGIGSSAAALALILLLIWESWDTDGINEDIYFKVLACLVVVAVSIAHLSLLSAVQRMSGLLRWCQRGTLLVIVAVATLLIVGILSLPEFDKELYLRLLGVLVILDVLGTIFVGVFALKSPGPKNKVLRRRADLIRERLGK